MVNKLVDLNIISNLVNKKNCVYVQFSNLIEYKKKFIDIQYGLFSLKNNDICYAVQLQNDFSLIYKFLSIRKKLKNIPNQKIIQ